jgi:tRNA (cmo5U34)-methyltransferase
MDAVRQHFEQEAADFDRIIVELIPHYADMVQALVAAIPFDGNAQIQVVDLGCGTGTVAKQVLEMFPHAEVTCLDLADNMIAMAKAKLGSCPRVRYITGDFNTFDLRSNYDAIVSSLALHHLVTDEDKRRFYRRSYQRLNPGGVFYNADVVLASTDFLQKVYMRQWREFMLRGVPEKEIDGKWIPKYHAEDRPARLKDHLTWMSEIGFSGVDVLWKYYNFAVYGGTKYGDPTVRGNEAENRCE